MGVIGDILKRAASTENRIEEVSRIYHPATNIEVVDEGEYRNYKYLISSDGEYPRIIIKMHEGNLYAGCDTVVLKGSIKCERFVTPKEVRMLYRFNNDGDFITEMNESGVQHLLPEIHSLAKHIIDLIIEDEDDLWKHPD